jgi:hypothetical protein
MKMTLNPLVSCRSSPGTFPDSEKNARLKFVFVMVAPFSSTADLPLGEPFVHGGTGKPSELAREFQMRQTAHEKIVNRADGHAKAGGELPFVFVFRFPDLACAGDGLHYYVLRHRDSP